MYCVCWLFYLPVFSVSSLRAAPVLGRSLFLLLAWLLLLCVSGGFRVVFLGVCRLGVGVGWAGGGRHNYTMAQST